MPESPVHWIVLSPHLDDAVLSCGGWIWQQSQAGSVVHIWTIFAGDRPMVALSLFAEELHARWMSGDNPPAARRVEDTYACAMVKALPRHFQWPDVIYRNDPDTSAPLITSGDQLTSLPLVEEELIANIATAIGADITTDTRIVCPLGVGAHIDHRVVRKAAVTLGIQLDWYADYPYAGAPGMRLEDWIPQGAQQVEPAVSMDGLAVWQDAVSAYASQINSFWKDDDEMRIALQTFWHQGYGRPYSTASG